MTATDPHDGWRSVRDLRIRIKPTGGGIVYNCMACGGSADVSCELDQIGSVVANHEAKCPGAPDEATDPTRHSIWENNRAHERQHGRAPDFPL